MASPAHGTQGDRLLDPERSRAPDCDWLDDAGLWPACEGLMHRIDRLKRVGLVAVFAGVAAFSARANDSSVELGVGGLKFTQTADVSMESEDLTITPETVTVKYKFLNTSQKPVTLTIGFPLPDIDLGDTDVNYAFPIGDPINFMGFQTRIDGKPVKFDIVQKAVLANKDVTEAVKAAGLLLLPIGSQQNGISALTQEAREKLLNDGLIVANGTDQNGQPIYAGTWVVKTSVVRRQTFPPNVPVNVEHRYRTSLGVTFDTVLRKPIRESEGMKAEFQRYKTEYCIPEDLLKSIDKAAGATEANTAKLQERRISYILSTGANWAGPIKDFRLVVDKGRADRLVSFCGEGIKKISATAFEMRAQNFTPTKDLKILLIARAE
jgi:hypothetical protein